MMRAAAIGLGCAAMLFGTPALAQTLEPPPPLSPQTPGSPTPAYVPGDATTGPMTPSRGADDEKKDSGLGLEWVYLDADIGAAYVGLDSLNSNNLQIQSKGRAGPTFSAAAGVRLLFLTIGVRARDLVFSDLSLWELNGEIALHTRLDHFDPYIGLRGGYAFDGSLSGGAVQAFQGGTPSGVNVHGWNVGPMIGCDYYFNHFLSLGIDVNAEFLFLERPPAQLPAALANPPVPLNPMQQMQLQQLQTAYKESGSSVGFGGEGSLHFGVHF